MDGQASEHSLSPTLTDIAEHAGVSLASVSRVLNGGSASASMRYRVEAAMMTLGIFPRCGPRHPEEKWPRLNCGFDF